MKSLCALFFLALSLTAFAQYEVGERTITYNDPARSNRAIECEIYYPAASAGSNVAVATGEFPVIVFGHGFAMQVGAYPNFRSEYVPQGYIMVFPTTEGSFLSPNHGAFGEDLRFLVDKIQAEGQNSGSPFYQAVANRSAIMGHSMGGGATFLGASSNANIDCIVGLAPAETNPSAVSAAASITAPTLVFSGTSDGVTPPADHHIPIYNAVGADCKYFVNIENGSHCHFASNTVTCTLGEIIPGSLDAEDQRQVTYAVLTPWFDYFLKDVCDAWDDFQTALSTETDLGTVNSECANDAPVIADNNGTLESDAQNNYQWYLNGNEIPNADQQNFTYTQAGTYQVGSTILGNCPTLSNEITVQITGLEEVEIQLVMNQNLIEIYPKQELNKVRLEWFDVSGRLLDSSVHGTVPNSGRIVLDRPTVNGIKLLRLSSSQTSKVWRVN